MRLNQYLFLSGRCEEAFRTYQRILGGEITLMLKHADTPAASHVPPEWQDKIMHACLDLGGRRLMGSDAPPGRAKPLGGFCVQVAAGSVAEAERAFAALAEGGAVTMPLQQTFWSERFGMLVDRFGVPWMIDCEPPARVEGEAA
ncbi:VOC family protein [Methylobacterium durans]|uniref:VOC family protein n=1 Tax=Methylobacterium durans TaxID=2202825 RepID=A0A2U8WBT3_9HYPH|nr:VOC family protein [Methylobacterium durans]AWN43615.1 VOC family protein [Methylobacterium durans]